MQKEKDQLQKEKDGLQKEKDELLAKLAAMMVTKGGNSFTSVCYLLEFLDTV